jgi:hypothetical protein
VSWLSARACDILQTNDGGTVWISVSIYRRAPAPAYIVFSCTYRCAVLLRCDVDEGDRVVLEGDIAVLCASVIKSFFLSPCLKLMISKKRPWNS